MLLLCKSNRFWMPILTIHFPKYGPRIKLLHIGTNKKTSRDRKQSKSVPMRRLRWEKREHEASLNLMLAHELLIPV